MKTLAILAALMVIVTTTAKSAESARQITANENTVYSVQTHDHVYSAIVESYKKIFLSPLGKELCGITSNTLFWETFLGLETSDIRNLLELCCNKADILISAPIRKKRYFFVVDPQEQIPFESWTDFRNQTYFFVHDQKLDQKTLENLLIHELAISLDTKTFIFDLDTKDMMQIQSTSFREGDLWEQIPIDPRYSQFKSVRGASAIRLLARSSQLMQWTAHQPIAMAFKTMRAINVERIAAGISPTTSLNAEACAIELQYWYDQFDKKSPSPLKAREFENAAQLAFDIQAQHSAPANSIEAESILNFIKNKDLHFPISPEKSFCSYMSTPRFWSSDHRSVGFGPRPRVTGGSGAAALTTYEEGKKTLPLMETEQIDLRELQIVRDKNSLEFWRYQQKPIFWPSTSTIQKQNAGSR